MFCPNSQRLQGVLHVSNCRIRLNSRLRVFYGKAKTKGHFEASYGHRFRPIKVYNPDGIANGTIRVRSVTRRVPILQKTAAAIPHLFEISTSVLID